MAPRRFSIGFDDIPKERSGFIRSRLTKRPRIANDDEDVIGLRVKKEKTPARSSKKQCRELQSQTEAQHPELSAGIDFGMTYSGLAFASVNANAQSVSVHNEWPGTIDPWEKMPSVGAYRKENQDFDFGEQEYKAGYEVEPGMTVRAYMKHSLDVAAPRTKFDDGILDTAAGQLMLRSSSGQTDINHTVQYLKYLYSLFMKTTQAQNAAAFFDRLRINFTITHPAACSEAGKAALVHAAKKAGFLTRKHDKIIIQSEAYAAAMAAFAYAQGTSGADSFGLRTNVVVLDIGGLTQDAAAFFIKKGDPYLKLDPVCSSEGGKCGGTTIFCRFYELCTVRYSNAFTDLPDTTVGPRTDFLKCFEMEIRRFAGTNLDKKIRISLAMDVPEGPFYEFGDIVIDGHEMITMIDPLVKKSQEILTEQFLEAQKSNHKAVSTVVLCGGISMCPYIESSIRRFCQAQSSGAKELIRPKAAWSLVPRGAAISGLKTKIIEGKKSRGWFGVAGHRMANDNDDDDDIDRDCEFEGPRVNGAMRWHVKKGEIITAKTKNKIVRAYMVLKDNDIAELESVSGWIPLYAYYGNDAEAPTTIHHKEVVHEGRIEIKLGEMSLYTRNRIKAAYNNDDGNGAQLKLSIEQNVSSETGLIEFLVRVGNTKIGVLPLKHGRKRVGRDGGDNDG